MKKNKYCVAPHSYCGHSQSDCILRDLEKEDFETKLLGIFVPDAAFDKARSAANVELLQILAQYLTDNPGQRFGQALRNLDIVCESLLPDGDIYWCNGFYEEAHETLKRVKKALTG